MAAIAKADSFRFAASLVLAIRRLQGGQYLALHLDADPELNRSANDPSSGGSGVTYSNVRYWASLVSPDLFRACVDALIQLHVDNLVSPSFRGDTLYFVARRLDSAGQVRSVLYSYRVADDGCQWSSTGGIEPAEQKALTADAYMTPSSHRSPDILAMSPPLILVRHVAATGQEPNAPLTPEGERQAIALSDLLLPLRIQRVISSPFLRAIDSITPFCQRANLRMELDDRLAERVLSTRNLPDWRDQLRRSFEDLDYCLPDGESSRSAQSRGIAAVRDAEVTGQRCVLVTHGNLLALILKSIDTTFGYDQWCDLTNPDVFVVDGDDGGARRVARVWGAHKPL